MPEVLDFAQVLALLSDEQLTQIGQRAEVARDQAGDPWPLVFEGIAVCAELALRARRDRKRRQLTLPMA